MVNTLVLLQNALLKQAPVRHPVAYIQIANEAQRPLTEALALKMQSFGYEAPGIDRGSDRAPLMTQVAGSNLRNARPGTDTCEIWFARSHCAPDGPSIVGCKGA